MIYEIEILILKPNLKIMSLDKKNNEREIKKNKRKFSNKRQFESLAAFGLYVLEQVDNNTILQRAVQQICIIFDADYTLIYKINPQKNALDLKAYSGFEIEDETVRNLENNPKWDAGFLLSMEKPLVIPDYSKKKGPGISPVAASLDVSSGVHIKIKGSSKAYGVLSIYSTAARHFNRLNLNYIRIAANLIGMSIERARYQKELEDKNRRLEKEAQKNRRYQKEILHSNIAERWQIGGYLHDNLGQILASAKILIHELEKKLAIKNIDTADKFDDLKELLDKGIESVRNISHDLIPVDIEKEGVAHAFRILIRQARKIHNINCTFETSEILDEIKNRKLATHLYHVIQEAIKNAALHGAAKNIRIEAHKTGDSLFIRIEDDGTGFQEHFTKNHGRGIQIMRYRAELLGGTLTITNKKTSGEPGAGVVIICTLPLRTLY